MFLIFDDRPADSPLVERIWRSHSERDGVFLSVAASHFEMAVTRHQGKTFLTPAERDSALKDIEQLPKRFKVMAVDAEAVKAYIAENV